MPPKHEIEFPSKLPDEEITRYDLLTQPPLTHEADYVSEGDYGTWHGPDQLGKSVPSHMLDAYGTFADFIQTQNIKTPFFDESGKFNLNPAKWLNAPIEEDSELYASLFDAWSQSGMPKVEHEGLSMFELPIYSARGTYREDLNTVNLRTNKFPIGDILTPRSAMKILLDELAHGQQFTQGDPRIQTERAYEGHDYSAKKRYTSGQTEGLIEDLPFLEYEAHEIIAPQWQGIEDDLRKAEITRIRDRYKEKIANRKKLMAKGDWDSE